MANRVVLDAMIRRADFAQQSESSTIELGDKLMMEQIAGKSPMMKLLRKPDFQRETNQWTPSQVASLIKSFATGELIPALILWKSDSFVFVIDGAHRLSALKAWAENDFGAGNESFAYFDGNIPEDQKKRAKQTQRLVEREVGRYSDLMSLSGDALEKDTNQTKLASTVFSRSLHVQWIQGSQEVAETSFFKINSQGTPLDPVEELLLKHRNTAYAIGARSIVRSGTGHKYWARFGRENQDKIKEESKAINELLFQPDVNEPIKTLDLPLGGTSSPIDALKMLVDIFAIVEGKTDPNKAIRDLENDEHGNQTIDALRKTKKVVNRLTGNQASSLGLHPAVYFYTEQGKHSRFLFLGIIKTISDHVRNNNKKWFEDFTHSRRKIEDLMVARKSLINQGLANVSSKQRIQRVANLLNVLVAAFKDRESVEDREILTALGLEGNAGNLQIIDAPRGFSDNVKSATFLKDAVEAAMRCKICSGLLNVSKSVSYDHKEPARDGGLGTKNNAQLVHPFCNSGIKC